MEQSLHVYNSMKGEKEVFEPITQGYVGMYVCGPTVYSDVHLGNCRTFVSFDIIYRYLLNMGFKVRYVRNITDVGHLEGDADIGAEDKMAKRARLEQLEPMEVAHKYTEGFHDMMRIFNTKSPSIEPRATGHIIEQIEMVQKIIDNGYAYVKNGSVYFNTKKLVEEGKGYGDLSGRKIEDLLSETRTGLKKQSEKENPSDFAIWIKADENHLMRWNSPWSVGFPGWHLECSAMSTKYLGKHFDIHGGGNDLKFPHHENEVAQNIGACSCSPSKYWLHTNMLLMNGKKMSKSDGNSITPTELFTGDSSHISKAYSPMVIRFFMIQSHYRSTLDLTDDALLAAEKGFKRLMDGNRVLQNLKTDATEGALDKEINGMIDAAFAEMNDDFNTPKALARLFEIVPKINSFKEGKIGLDKIGAETLERLKHSFRVFVFDIFGFMDQMEEGGSEGIKVLDGVMNLVIDMRKDARTNKDWGTADKIRDSLKEAGVQIKDGKDGADWELLNN
ncbi:MAG: cysteine--tRNA ligase [Saprospiraceae bacterium]|nr:cysteine--tRNA ligase [Saprospiraceae bacterium]